MVKNIRFGFFENKLGCVLLVFIIYLLSHKVINISSYLYFLFCRFFCCVEKVKLKGGLLDTLFL